jgi:quercetin dioxygenase-like cupin family protein
MRQEGDELNEHAKQGEGLMALNHVESGEKIHLPLLATMPAGTKTSAIVKTDSFEAVHLVLRSGARISPHAVDGSITLHCLEGTVVLETRSGLELVSGDWVYLDRAERHGLKAVEDSSLLLTILFDGR